MFRKNANICKLRIDFQSMTTAATEYYDQVAANPANTAADGLEPFLNNTE